MGGEGLRPGGVIVVKVWQIARVEPMIWEEMTTVVCGGDGEDAISGEVGKDGRGQGSGKDVWPVVGLECMHLI